MFNFISVFEVTDSRLNRDLILGVWGCVCAAPIEVR